MAALEKRKRERLLIIVGIVLIVIGLGNITGGVLVWVERGNRQDADRSFAQQLDKERAAREAEKREALAERLRENAYLLVRDCNQFKTAIARVLIRQARIRNQDPGMTEA